MKWILLLAVPLILIAAYIGLRGAPLAEGPAGNTSVPDSEAAEEAELGLSVQPSPVRQGDPAWVVVEGIGTSTVESLTFNGKRVGVFRYGNTLRALIGIDLRMQTGTYPLVLTLSDGRRVEESLVVSPRTIVQAPLGIPEELGGNTPESERQLVSTLVEEGRLISAVPTADEALWEGPFRLPLAEPVVVTDTYGYSRITGSSNISHKGTDYRAAVGTPLYAMNSGVVRFTRNLRNYGNTIIVDHGLGVHTIYMHLSEIGVALGESVEKGQVIGRTGDTGYVFGPHLHLTVRINGISIDPQKFLALFNP